MQKAINVIEKKNQESKAMSSAFFLISKKDNLICL